MCNAQHRIGTATIAVDLWLDAAASNIASPDRILAQFEDFYLVTLSVRSGIPVTVRKGRVYGLIVLCDDDAWSFNAARNTQQLLAEKTIGLGIPAHFDNNRHTAEIESSPKC